MAAFIMYKECSREDWVFINVAGFNELDIEEALIPFINAVEVWELSAE